MGGGLFGNASREGSGRVSNETLLYVCGIVLALSAVTVSFIGLKVKDFPGKAMPIVVLWFAIFVGATTTFAVLHAKDEDADKAKEAKYEQAGKEFEKEGGHVAPLGTEGAQGGDEEEAEQEAEEGQEGFEEVGATEGGDPEAGAMVYAENCSVGHGSDGHGGNGGPDLRTMPKAQDEPEAIEQVTEGGGGMPPFGEVLSKEEIQNVAAFVVQKIVGKG